MKKMTVKANIGDGTNIWNLLKSIVIRCDTVEEGVKKYENYVRS